MTKSLCNYILFPNSEYMCKEQEKCGLQIFKTKFLSSHSYASLPVDGLVCNFPDEPCLFDSFEILPDGKIKITGKNGEEYLFNPPNLECVGNDELETDRGCLKELGKISNEKTS